VSSSPSWPRFHVLERNRVSFLGSRDTGPNPPHQALIRQDFQRFLKALDVVQADYHRHWPAVAGDRYTILLALDPVDDLREFGLG
jgi:hypothetical protein